MKLYKSYVVDSELALHTLTSGHIQLIDEMWHLQFPEKIAGKVALYSSISDWNACISVLVSCTEFAVVAAASSIRSSICCNLTMYIKHRSVAISVFNSNYSTCCSTYGNRVIRRSFCNIAERLHRWVSAIRMMWALWLTMKKAHSIQSKPFLSRPQILYYSLDVM